MSFWSLGIWSGLTWNWATPSRRAWPVRWVNSQEQLLSTTQCRSPLSGREVPFLSLSLSLRHLVSVHETGHSVISSPPAKAFKLRELYLEHALPLVGELTPSNHDNLYTHRPLLVAYYNVDWSRDGFKGQSITTSLIPIPPFPHTGTRYWHGVVASVAHKFSSSDITFAIANEEDFPEDLQ